MCQLFVFFFIANVFNFVCQISTSQDSAQTEGFCKRNFLRKQYGCYMKAMHNWDCVENF
jgi:hypothetical protein